MEALQLEVPSSLLKLLEIKSILLRSSQAFVNVCLEIFSLRLIHDVMDHCRQCEVQILFEGCWIRSEVSLHSFPTLYEYFLEASFNVFAIFFQSLDPF